MATNNITPNGLSAADNAANAKLQADKLAKIAKQHEKEAKRIAKLEADAKRKKAGEEAMVGIDISKFNLTSTQAIALRRIICLDKKFDQTNDPVIAIKTLFLASLKSNAKRLIEGQYVARYKATSQAFADMEQEVPFTLAEYLEQKMTVEDKDLLKSLEAETVGITANENLQTEQNKSK